jgi:uncharacterized protein (TIGR00369 family)
VDFEPGFLRTINANLLYQTLGIEVLDAGEGSARSLLAPRPEVRWPFPDQPHGGILFTQMDTTMAWAAMTLLEPGRNCATIQLDIQYPAPAKGREYVCEARVSHRTGRICFVEAEIRDDEKNLVARGQGTFRVIGFDPLSLSNDR